MEFNSSIGNHRITTNGHYCERCGERFYYNLTMVFNSYMCDVCMRSLGLIKYLPKRVIQFKCVNKEEK